MESCSILSPSFSSIRLQIQYRAMQEIFRFATSSILFQYSTVCTLLMAATAAVVSYCFQLLFRLTLASVSVPSSQRTSIPAFGPPRTSHVSSYKHSVVNFLHHSTTSQYPSRIHGARPLVLLHLTSLRKDSCTPTANENRVSIVVDRNLRVQ